MSTRRVYDLTGGLTKPEYGELIGSISIISSRMGFLIGSEFVRLAARARGVMNELSSHILLSEDVSAWPGSEILGGRTSRRYVYDVNPASIEIVTKAADGFSDWSNPDLPEDLHFLRNDNTTVLGNIAHEEDVWLELSDLEFEKWHAATPGELAKKFTMQEGK